MANKREVPKDMSFVDRRGIVVYPNRKGYNKRNSVNVREELLEYDKRKSAKIGEAYAFFNCNATKQEIEQEIPFIRKLVKTPGELELSLTEGMDQIKGDPKLLAIAKEAKEAGIRYFMEATLPNATNRATADELSSVLNQAYQSPLYQSGEQFRGEIVYKEKGEYVSRE